FPEADDPPVIVADEPDPAQPDCWRLHAYFHREPGWGELKVLETLAADSDPVIERLAATPDWLTVSQAGLEPIRAGRFFVHTPPHYKERPAAAISFEIDAGLAFGPAPPRTP